ncbi:hypothetical protein CMI47_09600 [Candidatus Pacearchaeota archaeon]|nr:hypothetical protein [Candidatus Pacearchaeota archaeon]|tara:strand:- start:29443 stop:30009 length:567 start_codon:yes stop_codon:yes gene_type:complete
MSGVPLVLGSVAVLAISSARKGSLAVEAGDTVWLLEYVDDDGELETSVFATQEAAEYEKRRTMLSYFSIGQLDRGGHAMWWWVERLLGIGGPVDSRSWEEDTEDLGFGPTGFREYRYPPRRTELGPRLDEQILDRRVMTRLISLVEGAAHPRPWDILEDTWRGLSDYNVYVYSVRVSDPLPSIRSLKR